MRTVLVLTALAAVALLPSLADGSGCHQQRTFYPTYSYSYPTYYPTYYPVAVAVPVVYQQPYYYSTATADRDAVLAKAIAYDVLVGQALFMQGGKQQQSNPYGGMPKGQPQQPQAPAYDLPSANGPSGPNAGFATAVNPAFAAEVSSSCLKCHNGQSAKGGVDLSDLGNAPLSLRKAVVQQVMNGTMPKGGPAWSLERQRLAKEWFSDMAAQ